jgi:hypothetical protein
LITINIFMSSLLNLKFAPKYGVFLVRYTYLNKGLA